MKLHILNLGTNMLNKIENLSCLKNLNTLSVDHNFIGRNGLDDLRELLNLPNLV